MSGETITTASELDALPAASVIRSSDGQIWQAGGAGHWAYLSDSANMYASRDVLDSLVPEAEVLFRPDAPQPATTHTYCANCEGVDPASCINAEPATTDDAVERAVDAYFTPGLDTTVEGVFRDGWEQGARAARAAADAAAEVDREALAARVHGLLRVGLPDLPDGKVYEAASAVADALAARGDAATPTEVEWGVRISNGTVEDGFGSRDEAASWTLDVEDGTLMQRTVSAWREVTS